MRRTREERRKERLRTRIQIIVTITAVVILFVTCTKVAAEETQVTGEEYLASIHADNQARAELTALWESWGAA